MQVKLYNNTGLDITQVFLLNCVKNETFAEIN